MKAFDSMILKMSFDKESIKKLSSFSNLKIGFFFQNFELRALKGCQLTAHDLLILKLTSIFVSSFDHKYELLVISINYVIVKTFSKFFKKNRCHKRGITFLRVKKLIPKLSEGTREYIIV